MTAQGQRDGMFGAPEATTLVLGGRDAGEPESKRWHVGVGDGAERLVGRATQPASPRPAGRSRLDPLVSKRYHNAVAMTLRLTDEEQAALRRRAAEEGISMQDAARQAVRLYVGLQSHRDRVFAAAQRVMEAHAHALDRLGR